MNYLYSAQYRFYLFLILASVLIYAPFYVYGQGTVNIGCNGSGNVCSLNTGDGYTISWSDPGGGSCTVCNYNEGCGANVGSGNPGSFSTTFDGNSVTYEASCGVSNTGKVIVQANVTYSQASYAIPPPPPPPEPPPPPPLPPPLGHCGPELIELGLTVICDFSPEIVPPGSVVEIAGVALTGTVEIFDSNGTSTTINGIASDNDTLVTFVVPVGTPLGDYSVTNIGITGIGKTTKILHIVSGIPGGGPGGQFEPTAAPPFTPTATGFQDLISNAFNYSIILVGIAVFIMIMWGGFLWLTSAANPGNISTAKNYITNAVIGAVLLLSAYVILYTINPELVGGTFTLTGIPAAPPIINQAVVRMVATDELGAAGAIIAGCTIAMELRDITAVECPSDIADTISLPLDPIIETQDNNANLQVNAIVVHNSGNLGAGRKIVVLDTGYNYNHPELSSSYGGGYDFVNGDSDPMDDHDKGVGAPAHGSHVAGIITADGININSRGSAPQAQIIVGKVLGKDGKGNWSNLVKAINWAVNGPDGNFGTADDFRADAINISLGVNSGYVSICDNVDETLTRAIQYAKDSGVLPIIAAGNKSTEVSLPGCIGAALTVGAIDRNNSIAYFSGRGNPIDIVAPGVSIYSTLLGSSYGTKSGTSMATPVVSGVAALFKSADPSLTASELENKLTSTACDLGTPGKDNLYGWGRVNAAPGNCTSPPPPPPSTAPTGRITISPASCTKNTIAANPNCDVVINYTASRLSAPTSLLIGKNGFLVQTVQCPAATCTGQLTDSNPKAGTNKYSIQLSNGTVLGTITNGYIYTTGTINANFTLCSKRIDPANPNCNVVLTINTSGISPSSVVIKKDGINWRVVQCPTASCNTVTDSNPNKGIHTYTLHDGADNSRLNRATVTIIDTGAVGPNPPPPPGGPPPPFPPPPPPGGPYYATLCSGANYTGTCEDFSNGDLKLSDNSIGDNKAASIRGYATLCADNSYGGTCETFMTNDPDLSNNFIGNNTVSSIRRGMTGNNKITLCPEINLGGLCEYIATNGDDPDLSDNPPDLNGNTIGNDRVKSMRIETTDITACPDINYGGICEVFLEGIYPDLRYHLIGENTMSSYRD